MDRQSRKAFNDIKKLLVNPPVLKAPTPDGLFRLESDTLRRCRWHFIAETRE